MKEEINKDMEVLKDNQSDINISISQIKISIKSLENRMDQVEIRVSCAEDREAELDKILKNREKG
jgi:predicted  nucleic acid-binding Zn-ribbon protein